MYDLNLSQLGECQRHPHLSFRRNLELKILQRPGNAQLVWPLSLSGFMLVMWMQTTCWVVWILIACLMMSMTESKVHGRNLPEKLSTPSMEIMLLRNLNLTFASFGFVFVVCVVIAIAWNRNQKTISLISIAWNVCPGTNIMSN